MKLFKIRTGFSPRLGDSAGIVVSFLSLGILSLYRKPEVPVSEGLLLLHEERTWRQIRLGCARSLLK